MFGSRIVMTATAAVAVLAAGVLASVDFADEIRGEFQMGVVLPRQQQASVVLNTLSVFDGSLGGVRADAITKSGKADRPFQVGADDFPDFATAANRVCDDQKNECAKKANAGGANFQVSDCDKQMNNCKSQIPSLTQTAFNSKFSENSEFEFFCDD